MDMDFLSSDYYNLFDSLEDWTNLGNKYDIKDNPDGSGLIKFGEILYNQNSTSFIYICELCHTSHNNITTFSDHISSVHDFHTTNNEVPKEIDEIKPNIDNTESQFLEDFNISYLYENVNETAKESKNTENFFVIPVSAMDSIDFKTEKTISVAASPAVEFENKSNDELTKRPRSPSIMRKVNKDSRPIDFISNPWHCECGRIVPITHKYQHMKSHNDVPIYECQITGCFDIFFRQNELDEHFELIHNTGDPQKPFSCQFCQRHFSNKKNYSTHVKRIHLNDPRAHTCPYCHYYFCSKTYLQQHIFKKHNGSLVNENDDTSKEETNNDNENNIIELENNFPSEEFHSDIELTQEDTLNELLCKFCNTSMNSNEELILHMEKSHNVTEISLCRVCGCDINSSLHKHNCLRRVNNESIGSDNMVIATESNLCEEKTSLNASSLNEIEDQMSEDEMDFLKFLNVDFDR